MSDGYDVRKVSLAVVAGVFFGGIATGVAFPTLPLLDDLLGISAVMLGLILSANRFARLPMNAPAGTIIDRVGSRRPMIVGLFVQGLAPFGYLAGLRVPSGTAADLPLVGPVSNAAVVFLLARAMWGVGSAFVFIGAFATVTHVTDRSNRGKWLGYMRGGQSLGFPTGLVVGGLVSDLLSVEAAFLLAGVLAGVAGVVGYLVLPDVRPETDRRTRLRDVPQMVRDEPRVVPIGVGNMTLRFIFGGVLLATVAKYAESTGVSVSALDAAGISGLVLGVGVVAASGATVVTGRVSDGLDNRAVLLLPTFVAIATGLTVLAGVPTLSGLFVGAALIGAGTGGAGPVLMATLGDITPGDEVGRMGGVYNVMGDVGLSLGPVLAVPMVDGWFGFATTYALCAAAVVCTLLVSVVPLVRQGRTALPTTP
ncbi:MFS transporter [Halomarina litorea]|uniref:MFS transporter n=1 Tax=Halomarina litorea TaxID=2961595 RepID=UPI0020C3AA45|nr:MFS transporter [Halomarina sp. BCD28]